MMIGPASWQVPFRLASRPKRRHILFFTRSIFRGPNERHKGWTRPRDLIRSKAPKPIKPSERNLVFQVSTEVSRAVNNNLPVVALETTIYTHGYPYPENVRLALDLEKIVSANGAIPATIGVVRGVAKVGLTNEELVTLAAGAGKPETMKVSRRDLPYILGMVCTIIFCFHRMLLHGVFKIRAQLNLRVWLDGSSMAGRLCPELCCSLPKPESKFSGQAVSVASIVEVKTRWISPLISPSLAGLT